MTISAPIYASFTQANPEFSGAYIAVTDNDISTSALFDNKTHLYAHIKEQFEGVRGRTSADDDLRF